MSFLKKSCFQGAFCAAALTVIEDAMDVEVQDLWPPKYSNLYTKETDSILHDLERQSPQGREFRFYLQRDGEWKSRFEKISKDHSVQLLKKKDNGEIIGCGCAAIQNVFVKMNKDNKNALTKAIYTGDARVAIMERRKGYAKVISDWWFDLAKKQDASLLYCHIVSDNKASYNWVKSIGYKPIGSIYYNVIMPSMIKYKYIKDKDNLLVFDNDQTNEWIFTDPVSKKKIKIECNEGYNSEKERIWKKYFNEYQFFVSDIDYLAALDSKVYTAQYVDAEKDNDKNAMSSISTYRSCVSYQVLNASFKMKAQWIAHGIISGHYSNIGQFVKWIVNPKSLKTDGGFKMDNLVLFGHVSDDEDNDEMLYRFLLEFIQIQAMKSNLISISAVLCERDQQKFDKYIQSKDVSTECLMMKETKKGLYDNIKEEYDHNKTVWVDPREF